VSRALAQTPVSTRAIDGEVKMSLLSELYEAFRRVNGYALSAVGLVVTVLGVVLIPSWSVSVRLLVPLGVIILIVVLTLLDAVHDLRLRRARLPKVIRANPPGTLYGSARAVLLLEKSELFSHDSVVSVYSRKQDFEQLIGVGFVSTVQQNGLVQVAVGPTSDESADETWQRVLQNNRDELSQLLVKPSVPNSILLER
jgi:hypothetical protein